MVKIVKSFWNVWRSPASKSEIKQRYEAMELRKNFVEEDEGLFDLRSPGRYSYV